MSFAQWFMRRFRIGRSSMADEFSSHERLLLIDDDGDVRRSIRLVIRRLTSDVVEAGTGTGGIEAALDTKPAAVLLDLGLPDMAGLDVLDAIKAALPQTPVVVISGNDNVDSAVYAMRHGAEDFITKPFVPERLLATIRNILRISHLGARVNELENALQRETPASELMGCSARMRGLFDSIKELANDPAPVLVVGETGTGKELVAHALHDIGVRSSNRFVEINCAMLGATRLLGEMFGDPSTAGPVGGRVAAARGGTLFIDSICDMDPEVQLRLVGYLQSAYYEQNHPASVRFVAASNRDLATEVTAGRFRADLLYRLGGCTLSVPPLRERREDIPALTQSFLAEISRQYGRPQPGLDDAALDLLLGYGWPGNVRELENVLRNAFIETDGREIDRDALLPFFAAEHTFEAQGSFGDDGRLLPLRAVERRHLAAALRTCSGNLSETARVLGIGRTTLYRKIEKYGLQALSRG
jgi:DNA-binding NtrC family response regulator